MDSIFKALSEPNRLRILSLLSQKEMNAGEIAAQFQVTRPAISQHLHILHKAGLITQRREGVKRVYRLAPKGFDDLQHFLNQFWDDQLSSLKKFAEREELKRRN